MTNTRHTPGPWHVALGEKLITDVYAIGDNKQRVFIAECATQRDALLIAAAPAMYEALRQAYAYLAEMGCDCEEGKSCGDCIVCQCETALAQAEGRDK